MDGSGPDSTSFLAAPQGLPTTQLAIVQADGPRRLRAGSGESLQSGDQPRSFNDPSNEASSASERCDRCLRSSHGSIFPCGCPCLEGKVQDWFHLVLMLGVLTSSICLLLQALEVALGECGSIIDCTMDIVTSFLIVPSMCSFCKYISSYNQPLTAQRAAIEERQRDLFEQYDKQLKDLGETANRLKEAADAFGIGNLNGQRNYFMMMLKCYRNEDWKDKDTELLPGIRLLTLRWVHNYSESLLGGGKKLLTDGLEENLNMCKTLAELHRAVEERLTSVQIYLVPRSETEPESEPSIPEITAAPQSTRKCGIPSWIECGWQQERSQNHNGDWPWKLNFKIGSLTVLNNDHKWCLGYLVVDIMLILYDIFEHQVWTLELTLANLCCVLSMLFCFEQIHELSKLQKHEKAIEKGVEALKKRAKDKNEEWEEVKERHDVWLYRTFPALEVNGAGLDQLSLVQEDHATTSAAKKSYLQMANRYMDDIQAMLDDKELWSGKSGPWKSRIGEGLSSVGRAPKMIEALNDFRLKLASEDEEGNHADQELSEEIQKQELFVNMCKEQFGLGSDQVRESQQKLNELQNRFASRNNQDDGNRLAVTDAASSFASSPRESPRGR